MKLVELKDECKKRKLYSSGNKSDLIDTLIRSPHSFYWYLPLQVSQTFFFVIFIISYYAFDRNFYTSSLTFLLFLKFLIVNVMTWFIITYNKILYALVNAYDGRYDGNIIWADRFRYEKKDFLEYSMLKFAFTGPVIIMMFFILYELGQLIHDLVLIYSFLFIYLFEFFRFRYDNSANTASSKWTWKGSKNYKY